MIMESPGVSGWFNVRPHPPLSPGERGEPPDASGHPQANESLAVPGACLRETGHRSKAFVGPQAPRNILPLLGGRGRGALPLK